MFLGREKKKKKKLFFPILVRPQPRGPEPAEGEECEGFQQAGKRGSQANHILEALPDGLQPGVFAGPCLGHFGHRQSQAAECHMPAALEA